MQLLEIHNRNSGRRRFYLDGHRIPRHEFMELKRGCRTVHSIASAKGIVRVGRA